MAECQMCGREMNEASGCVPHQIEVEAGDLDFGEGSTIINSPRHDHEGSLTASTARCHDCGAKRGGFHHPGCDQARASGGRQLLMVAERYFQR